VAKELGRRPAEVREWEEDEVLGVVAIANLQARDRQRTPSPRAGAAGAQTTTTIHKLQQSARK
jgi:hypothetical protein